MGWVDLGFGWLSPFAIEVAVRPAGRGLADAGSLAYACAETR